ncbi:gamma-1-syntrophin-like isoform X2 [Oppia nitens]|uniref:gamma-1-syntrophin-like isoform X2 n=1 Tax=Oppia nitens TaxID=1686743 RepID=UPI0023D9C017|nr:gamma-1-syntrophin-like isoform X2 [Oppia nitens]
MAINETRIGLLSVNESNHKMRIIVNGKQLIIQECYHNIDDHNKALSRESIDDRSTQSSDESNKMTSRLVILHRHESLGLGLSIKGGSEHSLPILISRIISQSPADISKQLFIGDEILAVNGIEFDGTTTHDEALKHLRQSGDDITLKVRHHRVANIYRRNWRKDDNHIIDLPNDNPLIRKTSTLDLNKTKELCKCDVKSTNWKECLRMELFLSSLSQYVSFSDKLRDSGFEVKAINGQTAVVQCDNQDMCQQWCQTITNDINNLTYNHMKLINKSLPKSEQILFMGWIAECQTSGYQPKQIYKWSQQYLVVKGGLVHVLKSPPDSLIENNNSKLTTDLISKSLYYYNCYQSVFRCIKSNEQLDDRRNTFVIQSADQSSVKYFAAETNDDLVHFKNAYHRANYHSVTQLGSKTFSVVCDKKSTSLTLDWWMGFALFDPHMKEYKWIYKFHQLKHSSDDGNHKLSLTFVTNPSDSRVTETQLIECNQLQNLLYCMHAFLSAKVASVDPRFLQSS